MTTAATTGYSREPSAGGHHSSTSAGFGYGGGGGQRAAALAVSSTFANESVIVGGGSLSFSPQMQRQPMSSASVAYAAAPLTRLTAVPSTSCRALTFTEVPVHYGVTEDELAAAEAIQGLKTGGFSPFTSPLKDVLPWAPVRTGGGAIPSQQRPLTPAESNEGNDIVGGPISTADSTMKTFSTCSGDDSVLSATDLETAAYVSIPRTVSQARRKLNLDGLSSPPFKSIVSDKGSPDNDFSKDGTESQDIEFKTPKGRGRRRRASSTVSSVGSSPLLSPSPRLGSKSPNSSRFDSSLYLLTSKFIELMNTHEDGLINLNEAAVTLGVPKRRIYDITNVLEGIGFVEKSSKNCCKWGPERNNMVQTEMDTANEEMDKLNEQERHLDDMISALQTRLTTVTSDPENSSIAYICYEDLRNAEEFIDKTVIAVKAPPDTLLEVPDPGETGTFQMMIRSQTGRPIEVYLCPDRPASSKSPATGYYASEEFLEQVDESGTDVKRDKEGEKESASHLGVYTRVCAASTEDIKPELGKMAMLKKTEILPSSTNDTASADVIFNNKNNQVVVAAATTSLPVFPSANVTSSQFSPQFGAFDQQQLLFSPTSNSNIITGQLPFLSLDPPPEPDDYLFALGPYEGAAELFDMYVGSGAGAGAGSVVGGAGN